jgi:hypothetical protein
MALSSPGGAACRYDVDASFTSPGVHGCGIHAVSGRAGRAGYPFTAGACVAGPVLLIGGVVHRTPAGRQSWPTVTFRPGK